MIATLKRVARRLVCRMAARWQRWQHGDSRSWRSAIVLAETRARSERRKADDAGWAPPDRWNPTVERILTGKGRDMSAIVRGERYPREVK